MLSPLITANLVLFFLTIGSVLSAFSYSDPTGFGGLGVLMFFSAPLALLFILSTVAVLIGNASRIKKAPQALGIEVLYRRNLLTSVVVGVAIVGLFFLGSGLLPHASG